MLLTMAKKT